MQEEWSVDVDLAVGIMRAEVNKTKRSADATCEASAKMHRRAQKAEGELARLRALFAPQADT
jgi:hypothetical protein